MTVTGDHTATTWLTASKARREVTADELTAFREVVGAEELGRHRRPGASPVYPFVVAWDALVGVITEVLSSSENGAALPVHLSQEILVERPILGGEELTSEAGIVGARRHAAGVRLAIESAVHDPDGSAVARMTTGVLMAGASDPAPFGDWPTSSGGGKSSAPATVVRKDLPEDLTRRYAEVSGDHNPIHLDPDQARAFGFTDVIVHGMCQLAIVCEVVVDRWADGDPTRARGVGVRFSEPVMPGEELEISCQPEGEQVLFRAKGPRGTTMKSGWVDLGAGAHAG